MPATFVSVAEDGEVSERRRVLGESKDPFAPAELSKKAKAALKKAKAEGEGRDGRGQVRRPRRQGAGGGAASGGGRRPSRPRATRRPRAKTLPAVLDQGRASARSTPSRSRARRSSAWRCCRTRTPRCSCTAVSRRAARSPSSSSPVRSPRWATAGASRAREDCQILRLRAGETEFITVTDTGTETDAQYPVWRSTREDRKSSPRRRRGRKLPSRRKRTPSTETHVRKGKTSARARLCNTCGGSR